MKLFRVFLFSWILFLIAFACKPPRCPIASCHVRLRHRHGGEDFRGVPWWKRNKDPKIGQDYKDPNEKTNLKSSRDAKKREKAVFKKKKESQRQ